MRGYWLIVHTSSSKKKIVHTSIYNKFSQKSALKQVKLVIPFQFQRLFVSFGLHLPTYGQIIINMTSPTDAYALWLRETNKNVKVRAK